MIFLVFILWPEHWLRNSFSHFKWSTSRSSTRRSPTVPPAGPADRFLQMCCAAIGCLSCFLTGLSHRVSYFSYDAEEQAQRIVGGADPLMPGVSTCQPAGRGQSTQAARLGRKIWSAVVCLEGNVSLSQPWWWSTRVYLIFLSYYGYESQQRSDGDTDKRRGMKMFTQYHKTYSCTAYKCYLQDFYRIYEIKQVIVKLYLATISIISTLRLMWHMTYTV